MPPTKTQRLLDLIAFLAGRRYPVPVEVVMRGVPGYAAQWEEGNEKDRASVRRAFERDKADLRSLGIPITTDPIRTGDPREPMEGYRLSRKDFYLPYLRLLGDARATRGAPRLTGLPAPFEISPEEVDIALNGLSCIAEVPDSPLADDARAALRKLTFDLDPGRITCPLVTFVPTLGKSDARESLRLLIGARERRKRVTFRYRGIIRNEETRRDVAPYGLLYRGGAWYLVGHDALRNRMRIFRVSRMRGIEVNAKRPKTPDYEPPADVDLRALALRKPWELGGEEDRPEKVRVLFHYPTSLLAERNALGTFVEERPGGGTVRYFDVSDPGPFVRWILSLQGGAEILQPIELGRVVRWLARKVAAIHGRTVHV